MEKISQKKLLASSSGWVAVALNVLPGLGTGYIYQRRWRAYWITGLASSILVTIGLLLQSDADPADPVMVGNLFGFYSLFMIAAISAYEAGVAVRNARQELEN